MKNLRFYLLLALFILTTAHAQRKIMFLSDVSATSGDSVTVELSIHSTDDIRGFQLDLEYDTNHVSFGRLIPFDIINNFTLSSNETAKGKLKIVVLSFSGQKIEKGLKKLLSVKFKVREEASFSHTKINISNPVLSNENGSSIIPTVFPGYIISNDQSYLNVTRTHSSWDFNLISVLEYAALQFTFNYDTNKVSIDSAKSLSRTQNLNFNYNQPNKGKVNIVINSFNNTLLNKGGGSISRLFLTVKDSSHNIGDYFFSEAIGSDLNSTVTQIITLDSYYINSSPVIAAVSDITIQEDETTTVTLSATDAEGDAITYSAVSDTNAVTVSVSSTTLTLTPNANWHGVANIKAYASDGISEGSTSFKLTVTPVSDIASIQDVTIDEDKVAEVGLTSTFTGTTTFTAVSDTNAVTASISSSTLTLTPNANWHGIANIIAYASDGTSKDSTSFKLTVAPVQDAPYAFEWVSTASDTIDITQDAANLAEVYKLEWTESKDVDGDTIDYLLYASIGIYPAEEIYDTTSISVQITYQEFLENVFEPFPMLPRVTVKFSVVATDGIDTVKVTGDDRVLFVNRYEYLSTVSEGIPTEFALQDNYPNPFNPTTTLRFDLPEVSDITLTIYNMLGQKVKTFNMQSTPAGYHSVTWNATNDLGEQVGAGVYLYQLQAKDFVKTRKMVLLK